MQDSDIQRVRVPTHEPMAIAVVAIALLCGETQAQADGCYRPYWDTSCCDVVFSESAGHGPTCGEPPVQWSCPHAVDSDIGHIEYVRDPNGAFTDWAWDNHSFGTCTYSIAICGECCNLCIYSFPPIVDSCRSKKAAGVLCP